MRTDIKRQGNVDELLRGKERLIQVWNEPLARKNKSLEAESAAEMLGNVPALWVLSNQIQLTNPTSATKVSN